MEFKVLVTTVMQAVDMGYANKAAAVAVHTLVIEYNTREAADAAVATINTNVVHNYHETAHHQTAFALYPKEA